MKKGKLVGGNKNIFVFVFLLLLAVLIIVGLFSGFFGKITSFYLKNVGINITVGGPQIVSVINGSGSLSLTSAPASTSRIFNFTVYDGASSTFINDSTATLNVTLMNGVGEITRNASTCTRFTFNSNYVNFTCNITMWWWDGAGTWNITAFILDNSSNTAFNSSTTMTIAATTGFEIAPVNLTWSAFAPGSTNQTSNNDPFNLTNIGNQPIGNATGTGNVSINSTNLLGETTSSLALYASNFTVSTITGGAGCVGAACTECGNASGSNLNVGLYRNISTAVLPKGNYTVGDTTTGRDELYFCIRTAGFDLTTQAYSTQGGGVWTVQTS